MPTVTEELAMIQARIAELEKVCQCGRCRKEGQHHNGPCLVDKERDIQPDGRSKQAFLRMREKELRALQPPSRRGKLR